MDTKKENLFLRIVDFFFSFSPDRLITPTIKRVFHIIWIIVFLLITAVFTASSLYWYFYYKTPLITPITFKLAYYAIAACLMSGLIWIPAFFYYLWKFISEIFKFLANLLQRGLINPTKKHLLNLKLIITDHVIWEAGVTKPINLGRQLAARKVLYPMLHRLEPGIEQPRLELFTHDELPPKAFLQDVDFCSDTTKRYKKFGDSIVYTSLVFLLVIMILLGILGDLLEEISSILASIFGWMIILGFLSSILLGYGAIQCINKRQFLWYERWKVAILQSIVASSSNQAENDALNQLNASINKMRMVYEEEQNKTEDAMAKREEALRRLAIIDGLDDNEKNALIWYHENSRKANEEQQKKKTLRDRVWDLSVNAFYLLVGIVISKLLNL
jgi:hypothetical protein